MAVNLTMPKLGLTMETGKITEWRKKEGDQVKEKEILLVVETEKITYEVESPASGILHIISPVESEVPVAELIGLIAADQAEYDKVAAGGAQPAAAAPAPAATAAAAAPAAEKVVPITAAKSGPAAPAVDAKSINVVVIGGGPGGYPAAIRAAQIGAQVTLIENRDLGGTCLNRGCIPTKSLLQSARFITQMKTAQDFGVGAGEAKCDFPKAMQQKGKIVKRLVVGVGSLLKSNNVKVIKGTAVLNDASTVVIKETNEQIKADRLIIATGSVPAKPSCEGINLPGVITTDDALELTALPKSIIILGSHIFGVEFAQIFHSMGVQVTIVESGPQILQGEDAELVKSYANQMIKDGIAIVTQAQVKKIAAAGSELSLTYADASGEKTVTAEKILCGGKQKPFYEGLGIEKLGIKTAADGAIIVNSSMQTSVPNVYAIGDVIGGLMYAHVATAEGVCAVENALGMLKKMCYRASPRCLYTTPELAGVGLTEQEAKEKYGQVKIGRFPLVASGRALTLGDTNGMVKVIAEPKYGEVVGVHMFGLQATELIAEAVLGIQMEATVEEFGRTIHAHPTLSEGVMEAALDVEGLGINIPAKKK
jgi:dihydrolipoamide dehydrogenase